MYKIIGQDGKEYGPISGEQLRQWIAQNRVESRTPVFADGAKDWTFVGLLPEFAGAFLQSSPPIPTIAPVGQLRKTHGFATTGFICGILSVTLCLCCGGLPVNILGLVFSIIALTQIHEKPHLYEGRGFAIAGIILSAISLLIFLVSMASGHSNFYFNTQPFQ